MDKDFRTFQTEFKKRQKQFELNNYKVYFRYEPLDDCFADITISQENMVATVRFDKEEESSPDCQPKVCAKHEVLHLLINRLARLAERRFISQEEIKEAGEELVRKLEALIP